MRLVTLCILLSSAIGVSAYSDSDFLTPPDWFAHGQGNSGGVGTGSIEPINVIISAQSVHDPFDILVALLHWSSCFNLISVLQANVQPGQQNLTDQSVGLRDGGCVQMLVPGNHLRAWPQTLPNGAGTAYFIAASKEHLCRSDGGQSIIPWPLPNWHCIDGDGFNQGRDSLTYVFYSGAIVPFVYTLKQESAQLYPKGTGTDAGSGSTVDHIPYDGVVNILTLL
jgi:hypothetical protein